VVVTDQIMADGDGWDVLCFAREHCPALPVILVSGINPRRPAVLPDAVQFDASLRKPLELQPLERTLSQVCPAQRPTALPDAQQLATLMKFVELGEVSAIEAWCVALELAQPELRVFVQQVTQAVRQFDFERLKSLGRIQ